MPSLIHYDCYSFRPTKKTLKTLKMQSHLGDPLHWPLGVHLKDGALCCAGHSQLMPRVQADLLFTPAATVNQSKCVLALHHRHPMINNKKHNTKNGGAT